MFFKSKNGYKYDIDATIFDIMSKCIILRAEKDGVTNLAGTQS